MKTSSRSPAARSDLKDAKTLLEGFANEEPVRETLHDGPQQASTAWHVGDLLTYCPRESPLIHILGVDVGSLGEQRLHHLAVAGQGRLH